MTEMSTRSESSFSVKTTGEAGLRVRPIRIAHARNDRSRSKPRPSVDSLLSTTLERLTPGANRPAAANHAAQGETLHAVERSQPGMVAGPEGLEHSPAAPKTVPWFHLVVEDVSRADGDRARRPASEPPGACQVLAEALRGTLRLAAGDEGTQPQHAPADASRRSEHQFQRDRRAFPRRVSGCTVAVCRRSQATQLTAQRLDWLLHSTHLRGQLADISMNGLAFHLDEEVNPGEELVLRVVNRHLDRSIDTTAVVARVSLSQSGQWMIHCRLNKRLSFQEVQQLGQQLMPSAVV